MTSQGKTDSAISSSVIGTKQSRESIVSPMARQSNAATKQSEEDANNFIVMQGSYEDIVSEKSLILVEDN